MNRHLFEILTSCAVLCALPPTAAFAAEPRCPDGPIVRPQKGEVGVELSVFAERGQQFKIGLNSGLGSELRKQTYTTPVRVLIPSGTTTMSVTGEGVERCWRFVLPPAHPSLVRITKFRGGLLWSGLALLVVGVANVGGGGGLVIKGLNTLNEGTTASDFARADQQFYGGMGLLVGGVLVAGAGALMATIGLKPAIVVSRVPSDLTLPPLETPTAPTSPGEDPAAAPDAKE